MNDKITTTEDNIILLMAARIQIDAYVSKLDISIALYTRNIIKIVDCYYIILLLLSILFCIMLRSMASLRMPSTRRRHELETTRGAIVCPGFDAKNTQKSFLVRKEISQYFLSVNGVARVID